MTKVWGSEFNLKPTQKIIVAYKPLSVQRHFKKTEKWTALSDKVYLTIEDCFIILHKGEQLTIEKNKLHCLLFGVVLEDTDMQDDTERIFDWERGERE